MKCVGGWVLVVCGTVCVRGKLCVCRFVCVYCVMLCAVCVSVFRRRRHEHRRDERRRLHCHSLHCRRRSCRRRRHVFVVMVSCCAGCWCRKGARLTSANKLADGKVQLAR